MKISNEGLNLIRRWEGCKLVAYRCSAGVWTIGYGHTKGVRKGDHINQATAEAYLLKDVAAAESAVRRCINVPLSQCQFDALVSWTFNFGEGNLSTSTLRKVVNADPNNIEAVKAQITRWVYVSKRDLNANGEYVTKKVVSNGLLNRRMDEVRMYAGR